MIRKKNVKENQKNVIHHQAAVAAILIPMIHQVLMMIKNVVKNLENQKALKKIQVQVVIQIIKQKK